MADLAILVTIADNVFQLLQSPVLADLRDWKSALENLNNTVSFIKNMLLDADKKPELSHGEQGWIEELKEVLYEADDLFDEVITIAKQKEVNEDAKFSEMVLDKVSRFFSSENRILVNYNTSQEVKNIQQKLDAISRDHGRYEFKVDSEATRKRSADTCSFLNENEENIIGRDDDVKAIVDMLVDPNVAENVGFVAIVGVGGLGKTALAQLVFKHNSVRSKFEKKIWVCVSDQDGKELDVQVILSKIIESSTGKKPDDVSSMESIQEKLRKELQNKTFFLILDDVWTEDPNEWVKLRRYLTIGGRGSMVIVTTRSEKTAEVILGKGIHSGKYMLKCLSDDNSWCLFKLTAFETESSQSNDSKLVEIGKMIVKKCSNVPLAIKVLGTLLYGQTQKWDSFVKNRLPEIDTSKKPIMSILKLSYNNLEPCVKNCFRYCALFPKDFEIDKQKLIGLWMAQGYIDDSEECFSVLLKRCFFHDVKKDECGDIASFKMHDLMHDLAQEVARDEIVVAKSLKNLGKKIRHIYIDEGEWTKSSFSKINIRSCYMNTMIQSNLVKTLVANWGCLRTLRLCVPDSEILSESIGKLLHLRYLDLSENKKLKQLPSSIMKLYNLQSLILSGCFQLKEWPEGFCKLVNLRLLDTGGCSMLNCLPLGMDRLTNLRVLSNFKVGNVSSSGKQSGGQLKDLKFLVNLQGQTSITIGENLISEKDNVWEGSYLENTENLKLLKIYFPFKPRESSYEEIGVENAAVIAKLQPHRNLKQLYLCIYYGTVIPRWGRAEDDWAIILPNLVEIDLRYCERLHGVPLLSKLKHLKSLSLFQFHNLEYMENNASSNGSSGSKNLSFFPSLQYLSIFSMKGLKGWWRGAGKGEGGPSFPRLSTLRVGSCPELLSLPPCPSLKSLQVNHSNTSLRILPGEDKGNSDLKLSVHEIDSVGYLTTLPASRIVSIRISFDWKLKRLSEVEEVFKKCSSSLQTLEIIWCEGLVSISGGLKHLTALKSLSLDTIKRVDDGDDNDKPWRSLRHSLNSLKLISIDNMEILPNGMKHLTTLENLSIGRCSKLKGLPEWIDCLSSLHSLEIASCPAIKSLPGAFQNLTSLQKFHIHSCPDLIDICQGPSGEDWPKIRHIPQNTIYDPREYEKRRKETLTVEESSSATKPGF